MKLRSTSDLQTFNFSKNFSKKLSGGEVIGLIGNLGAGKTVFSQGLAAGLGIKKHLTSPTFVLMKVYPVKKHSRIKQLVHIDAYRLKSAHGLAAIGADEYFGRPDTVVLVEWADRIKKILPKEVRFVNININKTSRIINY
ncbi:MAG: tRNA (adenosine(37)-N6)-threonylcarbamoyltransferase complex ATPase subunit type 1 TsaE [bacterium]|nr:tRNA (adenosine(37)-N6)-threonylcarbamoyltransferase complex ATPase subunit type 1 TsaE [bacterium]